MRPCDVSQWGEVQAFVAAVVERFGQIDVFVNNAGVAKAGSVEEVSLDDWHATLATDLTGVFHGCRAALPALLAELLDSPNRAGPGSLVVPSEYLEVVVTRA